MNTLTMEKSEQIVNDNSNKPKIIYVGFSDGGYLNDEHYMCMFSEVEQTTIDWCKGTKENYPDSNITYLKMTERMFKIWEREHILDVLEHCKSNKFWNK